MPHVGSCICGLFLFLYNNTTHTDVGGASEAGGGKAVTLKAGKAACTHVLVKHKGQSSYDWGQKAQKPLVNPLWLWDSYEAAEALPLQDPVGTALSVNMYVAWCLGFACHEAWCHAHGWSDNLASQTLTGLTTLVSSVMLDNVVACRCTSHSPPTLCQAPQVC